MACWKVGTGHLIASLLLELESGSESVEGECCGILVEEEVLIAETAKRRRGRKRWWLRLAIRKRERPEAWGLRNEMTRGKARMAMAMALKGLEAWTERLSQLGFLGGTFCNLKYRTEIRNERTNMVLLLLLFRVIQLWIRLD